MARGAVQIGDLRRLLAIVEQDTALVRQLRDILRFPDDTRWQNLLDAVHGSVVVDNRVRAFQCPAQGGEEAGGGGGGGELFLLFACHEGQIDFSHPLGLLSPTATGSTQYLCAPGSAESRLLGARACLFFGILDVT